MMDVTKRSWAIVPPHLVWPGKPRGPLYNTPEKAIEGSLSWIQRHGWAGRGGDFMSARCNTWWCATELCNVLAP